MINPSYCLEIKTSPEFRFAEQLNFLRLFPQDCVYQVEDDVLYKAIRLGDRLVLMEITAPKAGRLLVRANQLAGDDGSLNAVEQYVTEWFDLDTDLRPFYAMARQDELLAPVVEQYYGLYIVGIPNLFEALAWAIIGQQINLTFAYTLKRRFVQAFGEEVEHAGRRYWLFPLPEKVAHLTVNDFMPMQFSRRKAEYLIGIARAIAEGQLTKQALLTELTIEDMKSKMVSLKGEDVPKSVEIEVAVTAPFMV